MGDRQRTIYAKGISLVESLSKYNEECLSYLPEVKRKIKSKEMKKNLDILQKTLKEKENNTSWPSPI